MSPMAHSFLHNLTFILHLSTILYYKALGCHKCLRKLCVVSKHWIAYWILQLICGKIGCMRSHIPVPSRHTNTKTITGCGGKIHHSAAVWRNLDDSVNNSHCMQSIFVSIFKIVSTLTSLDNAMAFAFMLLHAAVWRKFLHLMEIYFHSDFN